MIFDEFTLISTRALKGYPGAGSVRILSIQPGSHGPDIEWEAPLLASRRERKALGVLGPPAGPLVLNLLGGTLAARWRNGAPHCPDLTGWLWTGLIERISQDRRSRTCGEVRRRARSRWY